MYKVEKILDDELKCEECGYDAKKFHPNRPIKQLAGLFDVDHIISDSKHTLEGEQPSNYKLLCKQCHILKSYDSGDFISKKENQTEKMFDQWSLSQLKEFMNEYAYLCFEKSILPP